MHALAHEVGHGVLGPTFPHDYSSKAAFLNSIYDGEGSAVLFQARVQRDILKATDGKVDIGVPHPGATNEVCDDYLDGKLSGTQAVRKLGKVYCYRSTPSGEDAIGKNYIEYYSDWYDKHYGN